MAKYKVIVTQQVTRIVKATNLEEAIDIVNKELKGMECNEGICKELAESVEIFARELKAS